MLAAYPSACQSAPMPLHRLLPRLLLLPPLLTACGGGGVPCRDPLVTVTPMGGGATSCTVIWERCEDDHSYITTCDDSTYDGAYSCLCTSTDVRFAQLDYTFEADEYCELDAAAMTEAAARGCGWDITLDPG